MAKQRRKDDPYYVIFHHPSGCYSSQTMSLSGAERLALRDRSVIGIVLGGTRNRIHWNAPFHDIVIVTERSPEDGRETYVMVPGAIWNDNNRTGLCERRLADMEDRITYTPQTGWRFTRRCFLCDTGIALKEDEVYGVGGYVLCQSCEAGIKRSRITVSRNDLNRKWNRYLKAIDLSAASH